MKNNIQNIKQISIREFLASRGIRPATDKGYYGMYHSPWREDRTPSLKVDYMVNLWYDFGTEESGSVIDFVMKLERCDFKTAVKLLEGNSGLIRLPEVSCSKPRLSALTIMEIKLPEHPLLIRYMESRGISMELVGRHCKEIHYKVGGKKYFAIGFPNDIGGFELRNQYYKGGTSPKGITTIATSSNSVLVFEGFMDYLSYLSLEQIIAPSCDVVILNSVANLRKAMPFLMMHEFIDTYFDNDEAGRCATEEIDRLLPGTSRVNNSGGYGNHKDLNEYLMAKLKR